MSKAKDIFEIRDDEINTNEIIKKIQENIEIRKKANIYKNEIDELIVSELSGLNKGESEFQDELAFISSNWDISAEYIISSHRLIIGKILVWGRKLIHSEVKRYVDIIVGKQIEFNKSVYKSLNELFEQVNKAKKELLDEISTEVIEQVNKAKKELLDEISTEVKNKIWLSNLLSKKYYQEQHENIDEQKTLDINYIIFRDNISKAWNRISGSSLEDVPNIYDDAIEIFKDSKNVLDIGCGEGTFLEKLKEKEIEGYGIDINEDLIIYCKKKGLKVEQVDALVHLKSINDKSLDGVFAAHIIEHMQLYDIKHFFELCYKKMQFGSYIVLVTPNIHNIIVSSNTFYMDPTHINHLHPEVIKFLLESCGFRDIQERYYQPVPDEMKLKKIEYDIGSEQKKIYETMNYNIDILNNLLFGYRDVAIIAKK